MKRWKISLIMTGIVIVPATVISVGSLSSCSNDDSGISVSTKNVSINHNNGVGSFDIILDEQPIDDAAYVYIITAVGPHHVELLDNENSLYYGHPAVLYKVNNGIAHAHIGFTEFVGESTKTVVSLEVRYNNRKGQWVLKHINNINLSVSYVHNPIEEVHLFCLNDLHGVAEGYGESKEEYPTTNVKDPGVIRIANKISPIIDSHPGSFMVTAGDNNSGDMFSTAVHGQSIFKVLQSMGSRYSAVGNHAFEWGITPMATYQFDNWARTTDTMGNYFLASNILNGKLDDKKTWVSDPNKDGFEEDYALWQSQRVVWADPYKIVNMNGHLVCLIGLTTTATLADGNKSVVDNLSFINYNDAVNYSIYQCEHETTKQLFDNIESFVLLTHVASGSKNSDGSDPEGEAAELAKKVENEKIDAIISGHSHQLVNGYVYNPTLDKEILVSQAETEGRKCLDLTFTFDNTKPLGKRKTRVSQQILDFGMNKYDKDSKENWEKAHEEIEKIKRNPPTKTVANVISTFHRQTSKVLDALKEVIGKRKDSLLYPAITAKDGIGHSYFINQKKIEGGKIVPEDNGYIIDQLGAWVCRAQLLGFSSIFLDEIKKSSKGLTYPSVSLINQDSMKVEFKKPESGVVDVTVKDMYSMQTYENTTKFGYLTIWQLANVINHSLSGGEVNGSYKFNYYTPGENYYVPSEHEGQTDDKSLNNLSHYYIPELDGKVDKPWVDTALPQKFNDQGEYKGLSHTFCLYPCGPVQMYGVRYNVVPANKTNPGQPDEAGRIWRLKNKDIGDNQYVPDIQILDPFADESKNDELDVYKNINEPEKWKSAEDVIKDWGGMIPVITNNFLYDGANWETPLVKVYMESNQEQDFKAYPIINFSQITRDLLIEATKISKSLASYPFDMTINTLEKLVQYNLN